MQCQVIERIEQQSATIARPHSLHSEHVRVEHLGPFLLENGQDWVTGGLGRPGDESP